MFAGLFHYAVGPFTGCCHLTVKQEGMKARVLASEIGHPGRTVTHSVEEIAAQAARTFHLDPEKILFEEYVPIIGYFSVDFLWQKTESCEAVATAPGKIDGGEVRIWMIMIEVSRKREPRSGLTFRNMASLLWE